MTDRTIQATEAPFHGQSNGIDIGQLEGEILQATGFAPSDINSDGTTITITFTQSDPPDEAALLPIIQAHDGRPKGQSKRVRADGALVVALGVPSFDANPVHRSLRVVSDSTGIGTGQRKFEADCRLCGGRIHVSDTSVDEDWITVDIVDIDGVVAPAGTVLATPVPHVWIPEGGTGAFVELNSGQAIPMVGGTYIRFTYHRTVIRPDATTIIAIWTEIDGHE